MSHLLQMRGLKLQNKWSLSSHQIVASFTDAWIETFSISRRFELRRSHLLQMRGLKPYSQNVLTVVISRIFYRCVD